MAWLTANPTRRRGHRGLGSRAHQRRLFPEDRRVSSSLQGGLLRDYVATSPRATSSHLRSGDHLAVAYQGRQRGWALAGYVRQAARSRARNPDRGRGRGGVIHIDAANPLRCRRARPGRRSTSSAQRRARRWPTPPFAPRLTALGRTARARRSSILAAPLAAYQQGGRDRRVASGSSSTPASRRSELSLEDGTDSRPCPPISRATTLAILLVSSECKVLWLASWTIHNANHLRESVDGLKVGGHQGARRPPPRRRRSIFVEPPAAVRRGASLCTVLLRRQLPPRSGYPRGFRGYKGAQSHASRTKDAVHDVEWAGLGVAQTLVLLSLTQDYVRPMAGASTLLPEGRMIALIGDAELDEGNIFEAILEEKGW